MIQDRRIALVYRGAAFLFVLAGLFVMLGVFEGEARPSQLMYYTIQSNILILAMFGILFARTLKGLRQDGKTGSAGYYKAFEMVCFIDILLTLLVYWVMLVPTAFSMGMAFYLFSFANLAVHLVTPVLCFVDYILFTPSARLRYRDIYKVLIFPLSYVVFTTITGFAGYVFRISRDDGLPVRFPYFFFDYDRLGAKAFLYIAALVVFFLLITHGLYFLDKKLKKPVLVPRRGKAE